MVSVVTSVTFFVVVVMGVVISLGEDGFGVFVVVSSDSSSSFFSSCPWLLGVSPAGFPPKYEISSLSSLSGVFSSGIEPWPLLSSLSSRAPSWSLSCVSPFPTEVAFSYGLVPLPFSLDRFLLQLEVVTLFPEGVVMLLVVFKFVPISMGCSP
jgi:hypothetical protein